MHYFRGKSMFCHHYVRWIECRLQLELNLLKHILLLLVSYGGKVEFLFFRSFIFPVIKYVLGFVFISILICSVLFYIILILSVTCDRSVVFSGSSGFLHQYNWPPWYNWNIGESDFKHQHHTPLFYICIVWLHM